MCGIAGEFMFDPEARVDLEHIPPMVRAIRHRGPDQWGYWAGANGSAFIMNVRLSIVDLSNGQQPIPNEDGSVWVVLNGELYGYAEIAADLERRGHRFRTRTDTEVIVHLYEEYGEDFVDHLRGEYALALLDERRRRMLIVRDRFGIKPLFYAETNDSLIFASEMKALFTHPRVPPRLDPRVIYHQLLQVILPGSSCFEGVNSLEPGCLLRVDANGVKKRRYWDLPVESDPLKISEEEAVEEFRRRFDESVRLRLHGDVEVGAYVSGGLDSMAVAAAAARASSHPLKVFTVGFPGSPLDESPAAAAFAQRNGMEHFIVPVAEGDLGPHFERSLWHAETPIPNTHGAAKMILSHLARQHVKVVLTGEGADEAMAGYNVFRHAALLQQLQSDPGNRDLEKALDELLEREGGGLALTNAALLPIRRFPDYERVAGQLGAYPYAMARSMRSEKMVPWFVQSNLRHEMADVDVVASMAARLGQRRMAGLSAVRAHQYYLFKADLPSYILNCLGDRVEMAHSIEGRVPMLDHQLVEFAFSLPDEMKIRNGMGKWVMRRAVLDLVPDATEVKKRPFLAPTAAAWTALEAYLDPAVTREAGIFSPRAIDALRRGAKILPGGRPRALAAALLTGAASIHALHTLFVKNFSASLDRFAIAQKHPVLADGAVKL